MILTYLMTKLINIDVDTLREDGRDGSDRADDEDHSYRQDGSDNSHGVLLES